MGDSLELLLTCAHKYDAGPPPYTIAYKELASLPYTLTGNGANAHKALRLGPEVDHDRGNYWQQSGGFLQAGNMSQHRTVLIALIAQ